MPRDTLLLPDHEVTWVPPVCGAASVKVVVSLRNGTPACLGVQIFRFVVLGGKLYFPIPYPNRCGYCLGFHGLGIGPRQLPGPCAMLQGQGVVVLAEI